MKIIKMLMICIIVLSMVGGVVAIDLDESSGDVANPALTEELLKTMGIIDKFFLSLNSIIFFQSTVDFDGQTFECAINPSLSNVNDKVIMDSSREITWKNDRVNPIQYQLFLMRADLEGVESMEERQINPFDTEIFSGLIEGRTYFYDIYYCDMRVSEDDACFDSDGTDYFVSGYVTTAFDRFEDQCLSSTALLERTCLLTIPQGKQITCPSGYECSVDRCIRKVVEEEEEPTGTTDGTTGGTTDGTTTTAPDGTVTTTSPDGTVTTTTPEGVTTTTPPEGTTTGVELQHLPPATYKIIKDNEIEVTYNIRNIGDDMTSSWILEVQPEPFSAGAGGIIQALISPVGTQSTCDDTFPQNVHKTFQLKKGETKPITLKMKIPDYEVNEDGNTFLFPIITEDCGSKNFHEPFLDGKEDVNYKNLVTERLTTGVVPVRFVQAPIEALEWSVLSRITDDQIRSAQCSSDSECEVDSLCYDLDFIDEEQSGVKAKATKVFSSDKTGLCMFELEDKPFDFDNQTLLYIGGAVIALILLFALMGKKQ